MKSAARNDNQFRKDRVKYYVCEVFHSNIKYINMFFILVYIIYILMYYAIKITSILCFIGYSLSSTKILKQ